MNLSNLHKKQSSCFSKLVPSLSDDYLNGIKINILQISIGGKRMKLRQENSGVIDSTECNDGRNYELF